MPPRFSRFIPPATATTVGKASAATLQTEIPVRDTNMTLEEFIADNETDLEAQELIRSRWQRVEPLAAAVCRLKDLVRNTTRGQITTTVQSWDLDKKPPCFTVNLHHQGEPAGSIQVEDHGVMLSASVVGYAWIAQPTCGLASEVDGVVLDFLGKLIQNLYVANVTMRPRQTGGQSPPWQ